MNIRTRIGTFFFFISVLGVILYNIFKPNQYDIEIEKAYVIKRAHPEIKSFDGYEEPSIPDKAANRETLLGVDANRNGLRDDVEIWINRTQKNPNIRNAFRQLHQAYQEIMTIGPNVNGDRPEFEKANQFYMDEYRASYCLRAFFITYKHWISEYEFFNEFIQNSTPERTKKTITGADQLTIAIGGEGGLEKEELIKMYCKFNVEK